MDFGSSFEYQAGYRLRTHAPILALRDMAKHVQMVEVWVQSWARKKLKKTNREILASDDEGQRAMLVTELIGHCLAQMFSDTLLCACSLLVTSVSPLSVGQKVKTERFFVIGDRHTLAIPILTGWEVPRCALPIHHFPNQGRHSNISQNLRRVLSICLPNGNQCSLFLLLEPNTYPCLPVLNPWLGD